MAAQIFCFTSFLLDRSFTIMGQAWVKYKDLTASVVGKSSPWLETHEAMIYEPWLEVIRVVALYTTSCCLWAHSCSLAHPYLSQLSLGKSQMFNTLHTPLKLRSEATM